MPAALSVAKASVRQARFDLTDQSDVTGSAFTRLFGPPRWRLSLVSPDVLGLDKAALWETMLFTLRGSVNVLAAYDPVRPLPRGTLTGSPFVQIALAAGATGAVLIGGSAGNLLAGDWVQLGTGLGTSQLVKLMADAVVTTVNASPTWIGTGGAARTWKGTGGAARTWVCNGYRTITFEAPLRIGLPAGSPATLDHPVGYYRVLNESLGGDYPAGFIAQGGFAVDAVEVFG